MKASGGDICDDLTTEVEKVEPNPSGQITIDGKKVTFSKDVPDGEYKVTVVSEDDDTLKNVHTVTIKGGCAAEIDKWASEIESLLADLKYTINADKQTLSLKEGNYPPFNLCGSN